MQKKQVLVNVYERDQNAREKCIKHFGYNCQICGFDFKKKYGEYGKDFIHIHHINPIYLANGKKYKLDPKNDLIPVCPNCHAMIHRKKPILTPEELKSIIK